MNPFDIYPELRKVGYLVQWVVNLMLGILAVVLTVLGESPVWFIIVTAVFNFVWTYTGLTAQVNTPPLGERGDHLPHFNEDDVPDEEPISDDA